MDSNNVDIAVDKDQTAKDKAAAFEKGVAKGLIQAVSHPHSIAFPKLTSRADSQTGSHGSI